MFRALTLALAAPAAMAQGTPGTHFVENWDLDAVGTVTAAEYANFDETRAADMAQNAGDQGNGQGGGRMMQGLTLD